MLMRGQTEIEVRICDWKKELNKSKKKIMIDMAWFHLIRQRLKVKVLYDWI